MSESQPWLKVEHWYHFLVALGATGVVASLTLDIKGIANAHALLLSLGTMFVGIGEWINHPLQTAFVRPSINAPTGGIISGHPRSPSVFGNVFDIVGLALLALAIFKIASAA